MSVFNKTIALSVVASLFFGFLIIQYVGEKFFFDKLYYQKSSKFGYLTKNELQNNELNKLRMDGYEYFISPDKSDNTYFISQDPKAYHIAVIGDSFVWGQGVKKEKRFSEVLSKKLNSKRKTEIVTIGQGGDSFIDNLSKYSILSHRYPQDLYIFELLGNDILVWLQTRYPSHIQHELLTKCRMYGPFVPDGQNSFMGIVIPTYAQQEDLGWKVASNLCLIREGIAYLPKNAIYLIFDGFVGADEYNKFISLFTSAHIPVYVIGKHAPGIEAYTKYFVDFPKYFYVSKKETHPSALAHAMFADFLYTELLSNKQWKFIQ